MLKAHGGLIKLSLNLVHSPTPLNRECSTRTECPIYNSRGSVTTKRTKAFDFGPDSLQGAISFYWPSIHAENMALKALSLALPKCVKVW